MYFWAHIVSCEWLVTNGKSHVKETAELIKKDPLWNAIAGKLGILNEESS